MRLSPAQSDRAVGAVLGMAAGDALGAGYEFGPPLPDDEAVEMRGGGVFDWEPGEWTDDTSMSIPILRAAADGADLRASAVQDEIVSAWHGWSLTAPDVGRQTSSVLSRMATLTAAAARESARLFHEEQGRSGGNGSLMRATPLALAYLEDGAEWDLAAAARQLSQLTHWEEDAADACVLWTGAIRHGIRTGDLDLVGRLPLLEPGRRARWGALIADAADARPRDFDQNGWVVHALQGAWSAIVNGTTLADILSRAVRGGRDTDTVAAIAGGLAGAVHGAGTLPPDWLSILHGWPLYDAEDLTGLVQRATSH